MKILLFSGSHSRHLYVHKAITNLGIDYFAVVMERESLVPKAPKNCSKIDTENFERHFNERSEVENEVFSDLRAEKVFKNKDTLFITPDKLNSKQVCKKVKEFNADIAFIFGCDLIIEPLLGILPIYKINLHLGLSPWYRGSATLFWPFYFLEPQFAGITLHNISNLADAGEIFHQSTPSLNMGDGIHDVAAKAVLKAQNEVVEMIKIYEKQAKLNLIKQTSSGRIWRERDFNIYHLRLIYNSYNNQIVDEYLRGNLGNHSPHLINGF